ncbi:hypothetical protein Tco_0300243 [Tanacetum coccineum]
MNMIHQTVEGSLADAEVQEKASTDTKLFIQEVTPTEVIQDQEGSEKASDEVSTAGAKKGTASEEVPIVSTAEVNLSTAGGTVTYSRRSAEKRSRQDKGKAIMIEEEPKKKSKKELEQERQWDEEERQRAMDEAKSAKKIDWNDPSVIRYHTQKMKPKTVAQARRNMIKYLKNQGNYKISDFKGIKEEKKQKSPAKEKSPEKVVEEEVDTQEELKEVVKEPRAKRKKYIPRKSTRKRQSNRLAAKLVKERYSTSRPEGFELMLWGDLHTLFEPDEDDEIWEDQHEYNLLSWRLCDFCGIYILLMENGLAIHMLTEKKYPLSQEMLTKILSRKLEVDHESSKAFELPRFIKSQVQKRQKCLKESFAGEEDYKILFRRNLMI